MISLRQIISGSLDRFSQSFHRMKAFWVQMIDLDLFFQHLEGHYHGNQVCGKIIYPLHLSLCHSETE